MDSSSEMILVGTVGLRAPDGTVKKNVPLFRPVTPEQEVHFHDADDRFAAVAVERMKAAAGRIHIK